VAAAAAFAPVSQVFAFLNPVADRYLYFILPGLIGGGLLWAQELWTRALRRADAPGCRRWLGSGRALAAVFAALIAGFAWQSAGRVPLWRSETLLLVDAARHYPDGVSAHFLRARGAAQAGDAEAAVAALQAAADRGLDRFMVVRDDPGLAPLRDDPGFRRVIWAMAGRWIERAQRRGYGTQPELRVLGLAHLEREEYADAVAALEASLRVGGPLDAVVRAELAEARARLAGSRGTQHSRPVP
jgi:tetratricopeptide (TPR) repeat protein